MMTGLIGVWARLIGVTSVMGGLTVAVWGLGAGPSQSQDIRTGDLMCKIVIHCARGQNCNPEVATEGEIVTDFSSTQGWEEARDGRGKRITVEHELGRLTIEQRPEGTVISRNLGPNMEYTETRILGPEVSTSVGYCSRINNADG